MITRSSFVVAMMCLPSCATETSSTTDITTFGNSTTDPMPEPTVASSTGFVPDVPTTAATSEPETTTTTGHPDTSSVQPDFGSEGPACGGKIDFLFVLDTFKGGGVEWARMDQALNEVRPKFVDWFANFDTHWMVLDGKGPWGLAHCAENCSASNGVTCAPYGPVDYPCSPTLSECDTTREAGVTLPAGFGSANKRCELAGGARYIQSSKESDLLSPLECITTVGVSDMVTSGDLAMVKALSPIQTKVPGGCNLGFLRDDALLVVVLFTRWGAYENSHGGEPAEWAAAIYDAKFGDEDKALVIGIVTDKTGEEPTVCDKTGSGNISDVEEFLHDHVKHFVHGSVCAENYEPFLLSGMERALALCGAEVPK